MADANGIGELRTGVATEKAYAAGGIVYCLFQSLDVGPSGRKMSFFEGPVLAIETVEVAGLEENGQVVEPHFRTVIVGEAGISGTRTSRANPVSNAVRGERIMVIGDKSTRAAIGPHAEFAPVSNAAVPFLVLSRLAAQIAKFALDSMWIGCRTGRQTEHLPGFGMNLLDSASALVRPISDAGRANPYAASDIIETTSAQEAFGPFHSRYGFSSYKH